jgi:hypothetical protein
MDKSWEIARKSGGINKEKFIITLSWKRAARQPSRQNNGLER